MKQSATTRGRPLTMWNAIEELGWFWLLFASLVGAPSILSLLQMVFVEHRMVDALQWIVDGYNQIVSAIGAAIEPLLAPAITWLNSLFGWRLDLQPHWKPLFVLAMVFVSSAARAHWRNDRIGAIGYGVTGGLGAFLGAVIAGLLPLNGAWWTQGLITAGPITTMVAFTAFFNPAPDRSPQALIAVAALLLAGIPFAIGAGMSFIPALATGAGLFALGTVIMLLAVWILSLGLRSGEPNLARLGLTTLGGFAATGVILAADAAVKTLAS